MFVVHEVSLDVRYETAAARLVHLINWGVLHGMSEAAYEGGLETLVRVGPFGGARGLSKLVRVRALEPVRRGGTMTISLRWEATGSTGELFPMLDADLMLAPDGADRSCLKLTGSYRPLFGRAGVALDRAVMGRVASATVRLFLERVAAVVAEPVPNPQPVVDFAPQWRAVPEPGES
jgi:hypothetical protein